MLYLTVNTVRLTQSLMHTHPATYATRQIAITLIGGYQKHLSPHKGFSCAYRLLHGGESCSQYIKRRIAQDGLVATLKASRQRFQACRKANEILRSRHCHYSNTENNLDQEENKRRQLKRKQTASESTDYSSCSHSNRSLIEVANCTVDCANCGSGLDCSGLDCAGLDLQGWDCSGLECSGLDCGLGDCGGCDVGSCG